MHKISNFSVLQKIVGLGLQILWLKHTWKKYRPIHQTAQLVQTRYIQESNNVSRCSEIIDKYPNFFTGEKEYIYRKKQTYNNPL